MNAKFTITGYSFATHRLNSSQRSHIADIAEEILAPDPEAPVLGMVRDVEVVGFANGTRNLEFHANERARFVLDELKTQLHRLGASNAQLARVTMGPPVVKLLASDSQSTSSHRKVVITARGPSAPATTDGTAFIDSSAHPSAEGFYTAFPDEPVVPTGTVKVATIVSVPDMTVLSLLRAIAAQKRKNILIVCHGNSTSPLIPLVEGSDIRLRAFNADLLVSWVNGEQTEASMERFIKPEGAWTKWSDLREQGAFTRLLKAVRKLKLERVELRSCNTGSNESSMKSLREFFNCARLSAPTILDGYAPIDFGRATKSKATWNAFRKKHRVRIEQNGYAVASRVNFKAFTMALFALAESTAAMQRFADDQILGSGGQNLGASFITHALVARRAAPIFTANPDYRTKLATVTA